jgi:heptosyltransferase-1
MPEYGILQHLSNVQTKESSPYFVFLHGTTWKSKLWPESYWHTLSELITQTGCRIKISGGNTDEIERAKRIASRNNQVDVMPFLSVDQMANVLLHAKGVVAVDTGFAHLAAALDKPLITLYGATSAKLTGTIGKYAENMIANSPACSPCLKRECHYNLPSLVTPACYEMLTPERVWKILNGGKR